MANPAAFPSTLTAQVYPASASFQFPEFDPAQTDQSERYRPRSHPFGAAFSGGGPRAFSAAVGQMRGLYNTGLLDAVGAISCVSGGTWFGTMFSYAPTSITDSQLLGPVTDPGQITLSGISSIDPNCIASSLLNATNTDIALWFSIFLAQNRLGYLPFNRIYSRIINALLLTPFNLESTYTFFSLDEAAIQNIVKNNPGLTASNFYAVRPDRPYFIAGATQVYPTGENLVMRQFEYTPLYVGTAQLFKGQGQGGEDIGGGYLQSFAFDSGTPAVVSGQTNLVTVPTPDEYFLLSDVMGSSGAAPGSILNCIGVNDVFPEFSYWPVVDIGNEAAVTYSFDDGGDFENTGVVALLRRQYPAIMAFVNSSIPINSTSDYAYQGIDGQISRLFGLIPPCDPNNTDPCSVAVCSQQSIQVFPTAQFQALADGLKAKKAQGQPPFFTGIYTVVEDNPFGIPSYTVVVLWFYNDINQQWVNKLSPTIKELLSSTDQTNYLANFPNYDTVFQNKTSGGIPEMLLFTAQQINLLADMWCFTMMGDGAQAIQELKDKLA
jgi:hypothetical protein